MKITKRWLAKSSQGIEPLDAKTLDDARAFVLERWRERDDEDVAARATLAGIPMAIWREREQRPSPTDLSKACKFASLFVKAVFGGAIRGNFDHQYNVIESVKIDLCEGSADIAPLGEAAWRHDPVFFGNPDHLASLQSCLPRVEQWTRTWIESRPERTGETLLSDSITARTI